MNRLKYIVLFAIINTPVLSIFAQNAKIKSILFIGNSYTAVNDLPNWVRLIGLSQGDTFEVFSHTPGGRTFAGHSDDPQVLDLFRQGNYDVVVLQEQSQIPSFPLDQVESSCFPYAEKLVDSIKSNNPFAKIVFYSTWGRQNGDAQNCQFWPPVCTFKGMNQLLRDRYITMAQNSSAWVAPITSVWRDIRDTTDINLYQGDGSHPSFEGTHLAALTLYKTIFQKDVGQNSFTGPISNANHTKMCNVVKTITSDSLSNWKYDTCTVPMLFKSTFKNHVDANYSIVAVEALRKDPRADYDWYRVENSSWQKFGSGFSFDSVKIKQNDAIALIVKNACGTDTFSVQFAYNSIKTIINKTKNTTELKVGEEFKLTHNKPIETVKIYDLNGRMLFLKSFQSKMNEVTFQIPTLKQGFYIVTLNNEIAQRIMVQ